MILCFWFEKQSVLVISVVPYLYWPPESHRKISFFYDVLGFSRGILIKNSKEDDLVKILIDLRNQARLNRNFNLSDDIRNKLLEIGIKLNDGKGDSSYNYID